MCRRRDNLAKGFCNDALVCIMAAMLETVQSPSPNTALLELRKLRMQRGDTVVADQMDLTIRSGDRIAILGGNGVGKSSLLAAMAGVLRSPSRAIQRFGRIHYLSQSLPLESAFTVRQQLALGGSAPSSHPAISRMRMQDLMDVPIRRLSIGQRQRVALVQALLTGADVLLLDEPTASLDPGFRQTFWEVSADVVDHDQALVFVTHSAAEAVARADKAMILRNGLLQEREIAFDPVDRVFQFDRPLDAASVELLAGESGTARRGPQQWIATGEAAVQRCLQLVVQNGWPLHEIVTDFDRVVRALSEEAGCAQ